MIMIFFNLFFNDRSFCGLKTNVTQLMLAALMVGLHVYILQCFLECSFLYVHLCLDHIDFMLLLSLSLSVSVSLSFSPCLSFCACLPACLPACLRIRLSVSLCHSAELSVSLCLSLSFSLSLSLSLCFVSVCLSVFLCLSLSFCAPLFFCFSKFPVWRLQSYHRFSLLSLEFSEYILTCFTCYQEFYFTIFLPSQLIRLHCFPNSCSHCLNAFAADNVISRWCPRYEAIYLFVFCRKQLNSRPESSQNI